MDSSRVVSEQDWLVARKALLVKEKELTRQRDALNAERRGLPLVKVHKDYAFDGPDGRTGLAELFEGRRQLIVRHFMFDPGWDAGCPSCTAACDEISGGLLDHLHTRDTTLAVVSRAPLAKIEAYKALKGWDFPWYSSYGSDFNYDYGVTMDESVVPPVYNYRDQAEHEKLGTGYYFDGAKSVEEPGHSCFLREGDDVFHTYSSYARGAEALGGSYYYLDLTYLGRQEEWEEPKGRAAEVRAATPDFLS
jgi:predicted dithiol-disulfide oxidoreductase (DUF899 family)